MKVTTIDEVLRRFLNTMKASGRQKNLLEEWPDIVGSEVAQHLKICDIVGKELRLSADHPGWIQIGNFRKREFLDKIKRNFPDKEIDEIKISLG